MSDDGSVQVNLGLDVAKFRADLKQARRELDQTETKGRVVTITLVPKIDKGRITKEIDNLQRAISSKAKDLNQRGIAITPQFKVSAASIRQLRTDLSNQLKGAGEKGQAINLPVKVAISAADAKRMRGAIETQLNSSPIDIGLVWHWKSGPPPRGGTGGGGTGGGGSGGGAGADVPRSGGGRSRGGGGASAATPPTGGATPPTGGVLHAAPARAKPQVVTTVHAGAPPPVVPQQPATPPVVTPAGISRPRGGTRVTPRVQSPSAAPTAPTGAGTARTAATGTTGTVAGRQYTSIDNLKARGEHYTPMQQLAFSYERDNARLFGNTATRPPTQGVRGARALGEYIAPRDQAAAKDYYSPARVALRAERRRAVETEARMARTRMRRARRLGGKNVPRGYMETQAAFAGITYGPGDKPDASSLNVLDPHMGDAYQAYLEGNDRDAAGIAGLIMPAYSETARGKTPKQQRAIRNQFYRSIGSDDIDNMDQRVLAREAMAGSLRALVGKARRPSDALRKGAPKGMAGTKTRGYLSVSDIPMGDAEYRKAAGMASELPTEKKGRFGRPQFMAEDESGQPVALGPDQLEELAKSQRLSRLRVPRADKEAIEYLAQPRSMFTPEERANGGPVRPLPQFGRGIEQQSTGGWIERLMQAGHIKESQALNIAEGIRRGGTPESGGAMRVNSPVASSEWLPPGSAAADRKLASEQGRAGGGWLDRLRGRGQLREAPLVRPTQWVDLGDGTRMSTRTRPKPVEWVAPGSAEADRKLEYEQGRASGGFSRPFGVRSPIQAAAAINVATANSYQWKKARASQIRRQPFCSYCGIGRAEARATGNPLTAEHKLAQVAGGDPFSLENLHTACRSCNSSKGYLSHEDFTGELHTKSRRWKRAEGGPVLEPPRARQKDDQGTYLVGERGRERFVPEQSGWIIPNHLMHMLPKRAEGGPVGNQTGELHYGHAGFRQGSQASTDSGFASRIGSNIAAIQRVFVTNWPAGLITGRAAPGVRSPVSAATPPGTVGAAAAGATIATQSDMDKAIVLADRAAKRSRARRVMPPGGLGGADQEEGEAPEKDIKLGRASAEIKAQARIAGRSSIDDLSDRLTAVGTKIQEGLQASPARALSTSMGQVFQNVLGGRKQILERAGVARVSATTANRELSALAGREEAVHEAVLQGRDIKAMEGISEPQREKLFKANELEVAARQKAVAVQKPYAEAAVTEAEASAKAIVTPLQALKSTGIGVGGIVLGTIALQAAMAVGAAAIEMITKAAGPAAEAITGFRGVAIQVTTDLAQAIRASGGQANVAAAGEAAKIGLPTSVSIAPLTAFAQRIAGSQATAAQNDMIRAKANIAGSTPGAGLGLNNGPLSGIPVIGGALGFLGQTPGSAEQLKNMLPATRGLSGATSSGDYNTTFITGALDNVGDAFRRMTGGNLTQGYSPFTPTSDELKQQAAEVAASTDALAAFNGDVKRVSSGFGQLQKSMDPKAIQATFDAFKGIDSTLAARLQNQGVALNLPGGAAPTQAQAQAYLGAQTTGAGMFDPAQLLASMQNTLISTARGLAASSALQANTIIPASFAESQLVNPQPALALQGILPTAGPGVAPMSLPGLTDNQDTAAAAAARQQLVTPVGQGSGMFGGQFAAVPQADIDAAGKYTDAIGALRTAISAAATEGEQKLRDLGVPQSAIDSVKALGSAIAQQQQRSENIQVAQGTSEYNHELFLAKRNVGDLIGLAGKQGETVRMVTGYAKDGTEEYGTQIQAATTLGKLNRDQLMDQRASAILGLNISQRQLDFSVAMSKLSTPGTSPEERSARRQEAQLINQEQEKQLKYQEAITHRGFKIEDIGISRGAKDAIASLQQMEAQHAMTLDVRGTDKLVSAEQVLLNLKTSLMDVPKEAGIQLNTIALQTQQSIENQTGIFAADFNKEVQTNLNTLVANYTAAMAGLPPPGTGTPTAVPGQQTDNQDTTTHGAGGLIGDVFGRTSLTTGEAGHEKVIVLKNPRQGGAGLLSMPGYQVQAQGAVTIQFGDVHVRDDRDIDELTRKVEDALNRRAKMLGLGSLH